MDGKFKVQSSKLKGSSKRPSTNSPKSHSVNSTALPLSVFPIPVHPNPQLGWTTKDTKMGAISLCESSADRSGSSVSLSSVRNGGEGWGEEALCNDDPVGMGGAPLSPALSPFVPHGERESDPLLVASVAAHTLATIDSNKDGSRQISSSSTWNGSRTERLPISCLSSLSWFQLSFQVQTPFLVPLGWSRSRSSACGKRRPFPAHYPGASRQTQSFLGGEARKPPSAPMMVFCTAGL